MTGALHSSKREDVIWSQLEQLQNHNAQMSKLLYDIKRELMFRRNLRCIK